MAVLSIFLLSWMTIPKNCGYIYMLKSKEEVFDKFVDRKNYIENQSKKKIKTDNGLEYLSHKFIDFCKKHGIDRHYTVPGTLQQDGLTERFNRTIL